MKLKQGLVLFLFLSLTGTAYALTLPTPFSFLPLDSFKGAALMVPEIKTKAAQQRNAALSEILNRHYEAGRAILTST